MEWEQSIQHSSFEDQLHQQASEPAVALQAKFFQGTCTFEVLENIHVVQVIEITIP